MLVSLAKRFKNHYLYARYTPGIQKDFTYRSSTIITAPDSTEIQTKNKIHYEEKFGFGYSFNITPNFSAGFTLRYFEQDFSYF